MSSSYSKVTTRSILVWRFADNCPDVAARGRAAAVLQARQNTAYQLSRRATQGHGPISRRLPRPFCRRPQGRPEQGQSWSRRFVVIESTGRQAVLISSEDLLSKKTVMMRAQATERKTKQPSQREAALALLACSHSVGNVAQLRSTF